MSRVIDTDLDFIGTAGIVNVTSVNGITLTPTTIGYALSGGTSTRTLIVDTSVALSGLVPKTYTVNGLALSGSITTTLSSQGDVVLNSPSAGELLRYNGYTWVNSADGAVSASGANVLYLSRATSGIGSPTYDLMSSIPDTASEITESYLVNNNTVLMDGYLLDIAVGATAISPGIWTFNFWRYCSLSGD